MKLTPEIVEEGLLVRSGLLVGTIEVVYEWGLRVKWATGKTSLVYWDREMIPCACYLEIVPEEIGHDGNTTSYSDPNWLANAKTKTVQ